MFERKNTINLQRLRMFTRRVDELIFIPNKSVLATSLKDCAAYQAEISALHSAAENAKKILNAYYQTDRIRDMLLKFANFVEGINENQNIEIVRTKGYCNYIFYVENEIKLLSEYKPSAKQPLSKKENECDKNFVVEFVKNNYSYSKELKNLLAAKTLANEIICKPEKKYDTTDYKNYFKITEFEKKLPEIEKRAAAETDEIKVSLLNQSEAIMKNINDADELYKLITEHVTPQWIQSINNEIEECPMNSMNIAEIKEYLLGKLDDIKILTEKFV